MTNKEFLINQLTGACPSVTKEAVKEIFEMVNKKDWKDFCSQMGDYDHPEERIEARKELENSKEKFVAGNSVLESAFNYIQTHLDSRDYPEGKFYSKNFHNMSDEYTE